MFPNIRHSQWANGLVLLGAGVLALISARDYAGSWNDGSRLATVECLVDQHTLAIDQSIFVRVPAEANPFHPRDQALMRAGIGDKLLIGGHYYSDKSPVPAILLAGWYQTWQWCTGWTARSRPDLFCYWMTLSSAGLAYVVAVWCVFRLGVPLGLPLSTRLALAGSFALATLALPYARHVNNHGLLLGVACALALNLAWLGCGSDTPTPCREDAPDRDPGSPSLGASTPLLLSLGALAGLGYVIDLAAGPTLLGCTGLVVAYRCRSLKALMLFAVAALPWLVVHHAVNYAVGGTLKPANAVPEYLAWPGSGFNAQNMTGAWNHPSLRRFLTYALELAVGNRGFLSYNLPLFLALAGLVVLLARRVREWPELLWAACWIGGTWLAYSLFSNNYSGVCCSIRWFVPLLAPGYYVLAVLLRHEPRWLGDLVLLSSWGLVLACNSWWRGPWIANHGPIFWPVQAGLLLSWLGYRFHTGRLHLAAFSGRAVPTACSPSKLAG